MKYEELKIICDELVALDCEVFGKRKVLREQVDSQLKRVTETENDSIEDDVESFINNIYTSATNCITEIASSQSQLEIDNSLKLRTEANGALRGYSKTDFLNELVQAYKLFCSAVGEILNADTVNVTKIKAQNEKILTHYATIKDIYIRRDSLIKEIINPKKIIANALNKEKALLNKFTTEQNQYMTVSEDALNKKLKRFIDAEREYSAQYSRSVVTVKTEMPESFNSDYMLCVGKAMLRKNDALHVDLLNLQYKRDVIAGKDYGINGYSLLGITNMIIDENNHDTETDAFLENLIMNYIKSYPSKFKKICVMHNQAGSQLLEVMSKTKNCDSQGSFVFEKGKTPVESNEEEMYAALSHIDKHINDIYYLLGSGSEKSVYSYNEHHPDNAQPIILLIFKDYPNGATYGKTLELFKRIFTRGNKAGVITVVTYNSDSFNDESRDKLNALSFIQEVECADKLLFDSNGFLADTKNNKSIIPLRKENGFDSKAFFENVAEQLKKENRAITLDSIQSNESFALSERRKSFSRELCIPIGKSGSNVIELKLNTDGKAHVVVNGGTGSGKTAFLHTLILSVANNYSPEEVEINLFDFKDGVGFSIYKDEKLPHINFIALENKIDDAQDVLMYINTQMTERNKQITSIKGITTLAGYNEHPDVVSGKKPLIPRTLIIIDEYQFILMDEKCISVMEDIVRRGRSVGMSLVLVSQDVPTQADFNRIKQLLDHRFAFRGTEENVGRLIPNGEKIRAELELMKGLCFYEANDGNVVRMRAAFAGDDVELKENINKVKNKYPEVQRKLKIVGEPKPLHLTDMSQLPCLDNKQVSNDLNENGRVVISLGKYSITEKDVSYTIDERNPLLAVFGEYGKAIEIEALIIIELIRRMHQAKKNNEMIYYVDLSQSARRAKMASSIRDLVNCQNNFYDEGVQILSNIRFCDRGMFSETMANIKDIYRDRVEGRSNSIDPIEIILSSLDDLSEYDDGFDDLRELIEKGKNADIYFVLQFEDPRCNAYNELFGRGSNHIKDAIILSDSVGNETLPSITAISALNELSCIPDRSVIEYSKSLENSPLNQAYSFIVDDGVINKFNHYQLKEGWLDSLIKELSE